MPAIVGLFAFAQGLELSLSKAQDTIGGILNSAGIFGQNLMR